MFVQDDDIQIASLPRLRLWALKNRAFASLCKTYIKYGTRRLLVWLMCFHSTEEQEVLAASLTETWEEWCSGGWGWGRHVVRLLGNSTQGDGVKARPVQTKTFLTSLHSLCICFHWNDLQKTTANEIQVLCELQHITNNTIQQITLYSTTKLMVLLWPLLYFNGVFLFFHVSWHSLLNLTQFR